jgi:hypothetical protein
VKVDEADPKVLLIFPRKYDWRGEIRLLHEFSSVIDENAAELFVALRRSVTLQGTGVV